MPHSNEPYTRIEHAENIGAPYCLQLITEPALSLAQPRMVDGVPTYLYTKELIRVGHYVKASDRIAFDVTEHTLDHWTATFSQWVANGNRVPIPLTHEEPSNPDKNRGWLIGLERKGQSLFGTIELIGKDAPKLALASDVSIYVPSEFTDGKGVVYRRPITHVALCTDPVIPGLKGFESIAASLQVTNNNKETVMDWKKIAEALGIEGELDESKAEEAILAKIKELMDKVKPAEEGEAKTEEPVAASSKRTMDPMLVKVIGENRMMKLDHLVQAARITPAVKDKLAAQYAKPEALTLSLAHGDDGFDNLVSLLAENDPVKLKEQTGPQTMLLQHATSHGEENPIMKDVERRRKAAGLRD